MRSFIHLGYEYSIGEKGMVNKEVRSVSVRLKLREIMVKTWLFKQVFH